MELFDHKKPKFKDSYIDLGIPKIEVDLTDAEHASIIRQHHPRAKYKVETWKGVHLVCFDYADDLKQAKDKQMSMAFAIIKMYLTNLYGSSQNVVKEAMLLLQQYLKNPNMLKRFNNSMVNIKPI